MTTPSFLDTAATRADSLRQLGDHMRSLDWTSASLPEVEHEIPELDLAITVYRRMTGEDVHGSDAASFLGIAADRVGHLREVTEEMHSLEWVHASLADIDREIPELDLTMTVYRRLTGEDSGHLEASTEPDPAPTAESTATPSAAQDDDPDPSAVPNFSEFAKRSFEGPAWSTRETADASASR